MRIAARALAYAIVLGGYVMFAGACFDDDGDVQVFANGTPVAAATSAPLTEPTSTVAALAFTPTPYTSDLDPAALTGFTFPIAGACLPSRDEVMPNAPRAYRNGVHEGVDLYNGDVCAAIVRGTPVVAMHHGVVIRADVDYTDITPEQVAVLAAKTSAQGFSDPETLDLYRGRQLWIDHGNGVVSLYAHLAGIARGIDVGVEVAAGEVLAAVGESGTPESLSAPGTEIHLHAEVRIEGVFLGKGLPPDEVRRLFERLFHPGDGERSGARPAATAAAAE